MFSCVCFTSKQHNYLGVIKLVGKASDHSLYWILVHFLLSLNSPSIELLVLSGMLLHFTRILMTLNESTGKTSPSIQRFMEQMFLDPCMMSINRTGTSTTLVQYWTASVMWKLKALTLLTCTLGCGRAPFHGTQKIWTYTASTTCITVHQRAGIQYHRRLAVVWNALQRVSSSKLFIYYQYHAWILNFLVTTLDMVHF